MVKTTKITQPRRIDVLYDQEAASGKGREPMHVSRRMEKYFVRMDGWMQKGVKGRSAAAEEIEQALEASCCLMGAYYRGHPTYLGK